MKIYLYNRQPFSKSNSNFIEMSHQCNLLNGTRLDNSTDSFVIGINVILLDHRIFFDASLLGVFSTQILNNFFNRDIIDIFSPIILLLYDDDNRELLMNQQYQIFNNSNIWFRCINVANNDYFSKIDNAINDFNIYNNLGLYKQESAIEYITYHLQIQKHNHLKGDHKRVIPNLYALDILSESDKNNLTKKRNSEVKEIGLRILLVDDKINCEEFECTACRYNKSEGNTFEYDCKLRIIRDLLVNERIIDNFSPIWNTKNVKLFHVINSTQISKLIKEDKAENKNIISLQIVGVKNIEKAKELLAESSIKFDILLLDYFFRFENEQDVHSKDHKDHYGTELLKFIYERHTEKKKKEIKDKMLKNTGLENRFWIFPITAFESSFLTHLQCNGISLIDKDWYIYPPTNPIISPIRFLRNLNEFVGLMVNSSVYTTKTIIHFFIRTCEELKFKWEENKKNEKNEKAVNTYVPFMGSEYRRFIQLYGSRLNIYRDKDTSLFAKSIWNQFYASQGDVIDKTELITLNFLMQKFFYASIYLTDDRMGKKKLWSSWYELDIYIRKNFLHIIEKENVDIYNTFRITIFPEILQKMINEQ